MTSIVGLGRALLGHQRQQLLGQRGGHVRATIGGQLTAQQPENRVAARIGGRFPDPQPLEKGQQRQRLPELVTGAPEHLTPGVGGLGRGRPDQRGLADARLALDQQQATLPARHLLNEIGQDSHLTDPTDQRPGEGTGRHGKHGAYSTTLTLRIQGNLSGGEHNG